MAEREPLDVEIRAHYEHFKSRPGKRKTYTTLGFRAIEGAVEVMYIADYDPDRIFYRPIDEFSGMAVLDGQMVPRFTLLEQDIITTDERNRLLDELEEDYEQ